MHQDVMEAARLAALLLGVAAAVAADQADGLSGPAGRAFRAAAITAPSRSKPGLDGPAGTNPTKTHAKVGTGPPYLTRAHRHLPALRLAALIHLVARPCRRTRF